MMLPTDSTPKVISSSYSLSDEDEPLITIVETVAEAKGVDTLDLNPIQTTVDIDSLKLLLNDDKKEFYRAPSKQSSQPIVTFNYEGCEVTVGVGHVKVEATN